MATTKNMTDEMVREQMAREAFWGGRPWLMMAVYEARSYAVDGGRVYPATGCTLAECIATVAAIDAATIEACAIADGR